MRRPNLDIKTFSEVMQAVDHYNSLPTIFTQLDQTQKEKLTAFWDKLYGGSWERMSADYERWKSPNVYIVNQMWGSTACGWGGMGCASMTSSYTTVIENQSAKFIAVYYDGRLAYIAEADEKLEKFKESNFHPLPSISRAHHELTLIYFHNPFPNK